MLMGCCASDVGRFEVVDAIDEAVRLMSAIEGVNGTCELVWKMVGLQADVQLRS